MRNRKFSIWRYLLEFSESGIYPSIENEIIYEGIVDDMNRNIASKVAEIHPNAGEYFQHAMMPLYKGYSGRVRGGTENPVLAIKSRCGLPFVRISKLVDSINSYPKL